jgi:Protein of unknown function (DUF2846).
MRVLKVAAGAALAMAIGGVPAAYAAPGISGDAITIPAPPKGKGQVVFYRKGGLMGAAVACTVHENGAKVSSLSGGKYVVVVAEPGRHEYSVKTEATDKLAVEVEPDETQFVGCKIKMGMMVGRPDIRPSTEAEFRAMKSLKLVDADDMGQGALRPDDIKKALAVPAEPAQVVPAESVSAPAT